MDAAAGERRLQSRRQLGGSDHAGVHHSSWNSQQPDRPRSELKPGGLRELHGHPNADEWQYYIKGSGRMTVFDTGPQAITANFQPGDIGYVPKAGLGFLWSIVRNFRRQKLSPQNSEHMIFEGDFFKSKAGTFLVGREFFTIINPGSYFSLARGIICHGERLLDNPAHHGDAAVFPGA